MCNAICPLSLRSQDSILGLETRVRVGRPRDLSIPGRGKRFFSHSQTGSGTYPASWKCYWGLVPGSNAVGARSWSHPNRVEVFLIPEVVEMSICCERYVLSIPAHNADVKGLLRIVWNAQGLTNSSQCSTFRGTWHCCLLIEWAVAMLRTVGVNTSAVLWDWWRNKKRLRSTFK